MHLRQECDAAKRQNYCCESDLLVFHFEFFFHDGAEINDIPPLSSRHKIGRCGSQTYSASVLDVVHLLGL